MTEQANDTKKKSSLLTRISSIIVLIITLIFCLLITIKFLQKKPEQKQEISDSSHEIIGLSDDYSAQEDQEDLSDLTVNELREKGAEFIYQMLMKNQVKIEDLNTQLQALKNEVQKYRSQERISKMTVSYVVLRDKIFVGKNYNEELKSFEVLSSFDEVLVTKISKLKPALVKFSTKEKLQQSFSSIIPEIIVNKNNGAEKEGIFAKIRRNISRLIVVRRIDGKNPQEVDAVVVRIEKALAQENYSEALSASLSLDQSYHEILKNFLDELSASLEVHQADQEILNYLKSLS
ncbi:MAG: hypothetical protein KGP29_03905 [Proteobacteria bacterium]|nr:hypothetical protein [Pseudomonadota bacterium]